MEKLKMQTINQADANFEKLASLFPNIVTESIDSNGNVVRAIDAQRLAQEINSVVLDGNDERYQFTWPDKRKAQLAANAPITATLRPCREESVDFDTTGNLYIEGDNLDVLKCLKETYSGKIKMIYIDPPYNTGNDFVYNDDFAESASEYLANSGQYDEQGNRLVTNTESNGRYHTDWLNMMYPRLKVARDLLTENGVIFISIDDNEVENLIKLCDEIFGQSNKLGIFIVNSTPNARDYGHIGKMHEYVVLYAKKSGMAETRMLPDKTKNFKYKDEIGGFNIHPLYNSNEAFHKNNRPNLFYPFYLYLDEAIGGGFYKIGLEKKENSIEIYPPKSLKNKVQFVWRWGREKAMFNLNKEIIGYKNNDGEYRVVQKMRHEEKIIRSILSDTKYASRKGTAEVEELFNEKIFAFPKPLSLLSDFINVGLVNDGDIVLDFFSGSATTAHAVNMINAERRVRFKYILVQIPENISPNELAYKAGYTNICEIGKERIRRAGKKIKEENPNAAALDTGFRVLKLDSSNMQDVYYAPADVQQGDLFAQAENIRPDRTPEDLLFQVMLELGVLLDSKIETTKVAGKQVFNVADGFLIACFDEGVTDEVITAIANQQPQYAVLRDSSYADDSTATNFEQLFKTYSPNTTIKTL